MELTRVVSVARLARVFVQALVLPAFVLLVGAPAIAHLDGASSTVEDEDTEVDEEWVILIRESVAARNRGDLKTALVKAQAAYDKAKELGGEWGGDTLYCGSILGRALFEAGQPKEAQLHLERIISVMDPIDEEMLPVAVDAFYHLGRVYLALDDTKEGQRVLAACLELLADFDKADIRLRIATVHWHAFACHKLDDNAGARRGFEHAIELVEAELGQDDFELVMHLDPLSKICFELGDLDAALAHAQRRLDLCERHLEDGDQRLIDALAVLGGVHGARGAPQLEADLLARAVSMLVESDKGSTAARFKLHLRQAEALVRAGASNAGFDCFDELWAALLVAKAKPDQCALVQARMAALAARGLDYERLADALELLESRFDGIAQATASIRLDCHLKMREACQRAESYERAVWHIDQGLALHAAEEERNESLAVFLRMSRGLALLDAGRCREAGDALGEAREAAEGVKSGRPELRAVTAAALAQHSIATLRHAEAAEQVEQALVHIVEVQDGGSQMPHLQTLLSEARRGQGRLDEALALALKAIDGAKGSDALGPRLRASLVAAEVLRKQGKLAEAESVLDEVGPAIASTSSQRVSRSERFKLAQAGLRSAQGRHDEALKLARGVLEALEERFVEPHQRLAEACEIMALVLEAAGRADEASTFEKRAKAIRVALE